MSSLVAIDCETTGLDFRRGDRAFMVTAINDQGKTWVWEWPVNPITRQPIVDKSDIKSINNVIKSHKRCIFFHYKFDYRMLELAGVDVSLLKDKWEDASLAAHVIDSEKKAKGDHGLKNLAARYLGIPIDDEKELQKKVVKARNYTKKHHPDWLRGHEVACDYWLPKAVWPEDTTCEKYAVTDVERTLPLWLLFESVMQEEDLLASYQRERDLVHPVMSIEDRGITIINSALTKDASRYSKIALRHEQAAQRIAAKIGFKEFNIRSWQQIVKVMEAGFESPIGGTDVKTLTAKLDALESYCEENGTHSPATAFLWHILENKQNLTATKYLTNYNELKLKSEDGVYRLHPSMNQVGTATTRFSHTNPNNANVGKGEDDDQETGEKGDFRLRRVFGPYKPLRRVWYPIDYQQLQLRIFAYAAEDKSMIRAFEQGYNFHEFVASQIFKCRPEEVTKNQKRIGKNVNFGFVFGASPKRIEATAGMSGLWDIVVSLFPSATAFMQSMIKLARKQGYIRTPSGYRLSIPKDKDGKLKAYVATNYYVQGAEGDIVKEAMTQLDTTLASKEWLPYDTYVSMQVHDELVFDAPTLSPQKELKLLTKLNDVMSGAGAKFGFVTPVNISKTTTNWFDVEEISL